MIALQGKSPEDVHLDFELEATGESFEIAVGPASCASLPNGWNILYFNESKLPEDDAFRESSKGGKLLFNLVCETTMMSYATSWVDGAQIWSVLHDSNQGAEHLTTTGMLPPQFNGLRDALLKKQETSDGVDFVFDVPVDLFASSTGMRYDGSPAFDQPKPWQRLRQR